MLDYETVSSAKGRGQQGLFGINAVSQSRRTISSGQNFVVPLGVDLLPAEAGASAGDLVVIDAEIEPTLGKVIIVDTAAAPGVNQTVLEQGGELFFPTGVSVAPALSPDAGQIYVTDVGNLFGKTANKNDNPRKIIRIDPGGGQTVLISEINNFDLLLDGMSITNLYHPTGIDVDPNTGDLFVADSFSKTIWKLKRTGANAFEPELTAVSLDAEFLQPVFLAIRADTMNDRTIYITDGATVAPQDAYPIGTRLIHRLQFDASALMPGTAIDADTIFTDTFDEPRGIEVIPTDPLTGN